MHLAYSDILLRNLVISMLAKYVSWVKNGIVCPESLCFPMVNVYSLSGNIRSATANLHSPSLNINILPMKILLYRCRIVFLQGSTKKYMGWSETACAKRQAVFSVEFWPGIYLGVCSHGQNNNSSINICRQESCQDSWCHLLKVRPECAERCRSADYP